MSLLRGCCRKSVRSCCSALCLANWALTPMRACRLEGTHAKAVSTWTSNEWRLNVDVRLLAITAEAKDCQKSLDGAIVEDGKKLAICASDVGSRGPACHTPRPQPWDWHLKICGTRRCEGKTPRPAHDCLRLAALTQAKSDQTRRLLCRDIHWDFCRLQNVS